MSATNIVVAKLLATTAVTDIVGHTVREIQLAQKDAPPGLIVSIVSGMDTVTLGGAGKYYVHRMRVQCLALEPPEVNILGDAVMNALNGVVKETFAGCKDIDILFAGVDFTDPADDQALVRRILEFRVHWRLA